MFAGVKCQTRRLELLAKCSTGPLVNQAVDTAMLHLQAWDADLGWWGREREHSVWGTIVGQQNITPQPWEGWLVSTWPHRPKSSQRHGI
jgi:hypothetical protein